MIRNSPGLDQVEQAARRSATGGRSSSPPRPVPAVVPCSGQRPSTQLLFACRTARSRRSRGPCSACLIDVAGGRRRRPELARARRVSRGSAAGADEVVEREVEQLAQADERSRRCGRPAPRSGCPRASAACTFFSAVLVGAGQKARIVAAQPVVAREGVGLDELERVPEMRGRPLT